MVRISNKIVQYELKHKPHVYSLRYSVVCPPAGSLLSTYMLQSLHIPHGERAPNERVRARTAAPRAVQRTQADFILISAATYTTRRRWCRWCRWSRRRRRHRWQGRRRAVDCVRAGIEWPQRARRRKRRQRGWCSRGPVRGARVLNAQNVQRVIERARVRVQSYGAYLAQDRRSGRTRGARANRNANRTSKVSCPTRELHPATPSTRLRAGPSVHGVERVSRDSCVVRARRACTRSTMRCASTPGTSARAGRRCTRPDTRCRGKDRAGDPLPRPRRLEEVLNTSPHQLRKHAQVINNVSLCSSVGRGRG